MRIEYTIFPPLLRRLHAHLENGIDLSDEDWDRAASIPQILILCGINMGARADDANKRIGGLSNNPLTPRAIQFKRANDLALSLSIEMSRRLGS